MADLIKLKKGPQANLPNLNLAEPAFTTDEERLYIGGLNGNVPLPNKQDINTINSQLADITQLNINQITYNMDSSLQHFKGKLLPKIVFWGDSITNDIGDVWYKNWIIQFGDTLQLSRGSMYGRGYMASNDGGTPSGWTFEAKGCNKKRIYSTDGILNILPNAGYNKYNRKIDIIYSKEPDGGNFDILIDGSVVKTVSCNGTTSYGNIETVNIPSASTFSIQAVGKVYIEGYNWYGFNNLTDGILVHKVGHGGFSAGMFSDDEIDASIKIFKPDLTCIGHITNDYNTQDLTLFRNKIIRAIQAAKATGDVLLFIPCRGRLTVEAPLPITFDDYKQVMYDLAKEYNCALIDIDKFWGGYVKAKVNGILGDDVHPNQQGNDIMTDLFLQILVPDSLPYRIYKVNHSSNVGGYYDLLINFSNILGRIRIVNDILFDGIIKGYTDAVGETYARLNKLKVVNDGTADYVAIENYGTNGSIITLKDKIYSNILKFINANNISYIQTTKELEIDTVDTDKINNSTNIRNRLVCFNGVTISAVDGTNAKSNTLFVDINDNTLKFKDNNNIIKTVNLT